MASGNFITYTYIRTKKASKRQKKLNALYLWFSVDMKPPIKIEDVVKNEVKTEAVEPSNVATAPINSGPAAMGQVAPKKEEEYDSSATVRIEHLLYIYFLFELCTYSMKMKEYFFNTE